MTYSRSAGWWLSHPSEKYEFVSWDHDIPNIWKVIKTMFQTTNQFVILVIKKKKRIPRIHAMASLGSGKKPQLVATETPGLSRPP
jgi:hypothetical protein